MIRPLALAGLLLLTSGCAVEYAQSNLIPIASRDRAALRQATDVTVVSYFGQPFTFNGRVDERTAALLAKAAPVEAPLARVRDGVLARLTADHGYRNLNRRTELTLERDTPEAIKAAVTSPLALDFRTSSWGVANVRSGGRGGGEPEPDDPMYVHHFVRVRLVDVAAEKILWRAVCGLRGYPGDSSVRLDRLTEAGGVVLREKLTAAADGCIDELVEFFKGAD
jgi:hypothetical protein